MKTKNFALPPTEHQPAPYRGPTAGEVVALRQQYVCPGVIHYYREPLMIVEGHMQYLYDETGRRYLDAFAGIVTVSVGHCHPRIVERVRQQMGTLQHTTTIYLHPLMPRLAQRLAERMPPGLDHTYFTNSGSEANEIAVLAAREATGNSVVIALRNGYHGGTSLTMGLTAQGTWRFKQNRVTDIQHTHAGYCYRCPYDLTYPACDLKCAHDLEQVISYQTSGDVACLIGEPVQGVGGAVTPPREYFSVVYDIIRRHGGLCIADEVQGGFGRTGDHYWSHQHWGVIPDVVTMAKGLGNGVPLGAMTTSQAVSQTLARHLHFNTFGGNPVSMVQGLATLEIIDQEGLQRNAKEVGEYLKSRLIDLQDRQPLIGDVRGLGLLLGVELVADRASKTPARDAAAEVLEGTRERGLLIGKGGLYGNTLRIKPPLCITRDDADFLVDCLEDVLMSISSRPLD